MGLEKPHKRLDAWRLSMELSRDVYNLARKLPDDEKYGLSSQMKRAAVSIPSNIAEGAARKSKAEFLQFLTISHGSLSELDTQLELCCDYLSLLEPAEVAPVFEKMGRISIMLTGLKKVLRKAERE